MKKKRDDDNYPMFPEENGDTAMEDNEEEGADEQRASDEPTDGLGRVISDAKRECETENEKLKLEAMLKDHKTLLYPNCEDGSTKLGTTLELLKWKAETGQDTNIIKKEEIKCKFKMRHTEEIICLKLAI